jgi:hypothetical protein
MHTLKVFYRPDNYPEWVPWKEFSQKFFNIGKPGAINRGGVPTARANFVPRLPLGKPPNACDDSTRRNLRRGFDFQVKFSGTGHVIIERFRIHGQMLTEKSRAVQTP